MKKILLRVFDQRPAFVVRCGDNTDRALERNYDSGHFGAVIDLSKRAVVATVTGVGNDPYGLTILGTL